MTVEAKNRLLGIPVEELLNLLRQRSSLKAIFLIKRLQATSSIFNYSLFALAIGVSGEGDESDERQQDAVHEPHRVGELNIGKQNKKLGAGKKYYVGSSLLCVNLRVFSTKLT